MKYEKAEDISQSMCIMPWTGLATDASGGIRPCCWMEAITPDKFVGDPKDYKDSEYLKNLKETVLNITTLPVKQMTQEEWKVNVLEKIKQEQKGGD